MAGKTRHFGLAYFDYKDRLDTSISVKLERDRFLTIDDQLYGLFNIFGNGIVRGFRVSRTQATDGVLTLSVETGVLFCRNRSFESIETQIIDNIPANGEFYVFADIVSSSSGAKDLILYVSRSGSDTNAIRLARVLVYNGEVTTIDSSYRNEISFRRIIEEEVANHKHNGVVSKIDLLKEVKNTLPGARLGSIDASKVKYGTFKKERIPQINHNNLKNSGIVGHAGLETLARSLQNVNRQLLGEVSSVNMMKHSLVLKRKFPNDLESSLNMITFVPGLSPNSAIDFSISSANIGLASNCISGRRSAGGRQISVKYQGSQALNNYSFINNCSIAEDAVFLVSTISSSNVQFADSFENATGNDRPFPGFSALPSTIENKIAVRSDAYNVVSGLFSAKFTSGKKDRAIYTRDVSSQNNWTAFNMLFLSVKCSQSPHPSVLFYIVNENADNTRTESEKTQLLAEDEVTSNAESANFKLVGIDITNFVKNNVQELVFEVVDASMEFVFFVDNVKTSSVSSSDIRYSPTGSIRYRYVAPTQVILETLTFETEEENNTSIQCRYRTGSNIVELLNASFSSQFTSDDVIGVPCNAIEVEFVLRSNPLQSFTPKVESLILTLLVQGGERRIEINALQEWEQGVSANVEFFEESDITDYGVRIKTPLENKHIIYSSNNSIQQIKNALPGLPPSESNISIFGFNGSSILQSPQQIVSSTTNNPAFGLDQVSSVQRLPNRNYLVCDTYNNRVLEISRSGDLVKGFGGAYVIENASEGSNIPLCANLNLDTRMLQICFVTDIDSESIDIRYIKIMIGLTELAITDTDILSNTNSPKNCIQVILSEQKTQIIKDTSTQAFIKLDSKVISEEAFQTDSPIYSNAYGLNGLKLTKSNFTYVKQIFHPISAIEYDDTNWVIGNSLVRFDRIRAGLREDVDEFFIPKGEESNFYIVADISDELRSQDVRITFLNDSLAATEDGETPENVIITNGNNVDFEGEVVVLTTSDFSAKVTVTPDAGMSGLDFVFVFRVAVKVFNIISDEYIAVAGSPFRIEKRIHVISQATATGSNQSPELSSVIRLNTSTVQTDFAFGKADQFTFSDFTIGGIYKLSDGHLLIGGIQKIPEDLQFDTSPPNDDGFRSQAFQKLKIFKGKAIKINPNDGSVSFNYDSPDGLYVSDCSMTSNGNVLIAESAIIQNAGRTIKIDGFGNINFVLSNGQFSVINHARESGEGKILIST